MRGLARALEPIWRRLRLSSARGVVTRVDDTKAMQEVYVTFLRGEHRRCERPHPAGFTAVPAAGAEAFAIFIGADRGHGIPVQIDDRRYRPTGLAEGEVMIYQPKAGGGATVLLKADGSIELTPAAGQPVRVVGDLEVSGDVSDALGSMAEMRTTYNGHTHAETGGTTSTPAPPMT